MRASGWHNKVAVAKSVFMQYISIREATERFGGWMAGTKKPAAGPSTGRSTW